MFFLSMIDLSSFSFGLLPVEILAVVILLALAVMWVVRKLMFLVNESDDFLEDSGSSSKVYGLWDTNEDYKQDLSDYADKCIH